KRPLAYSAALRARLGGHLPELLRWPALHVQLLDLALAQSAPKEQELVHATGEVAHGRVVPVRGNVPVAEFRIAQTQGDVELNGALGERLPVEVVRDGAAVAVVDHRQTDPLPEAIRQHRGGRMVVSPASLRASLHAQDQRAVLPNLPV